MYDPVKNVKVHILLGPIRSFFASPAYICCMFLNVKMAAFI